MESISVTTHFLNNVLVVKAIKADEMKDYFQTIISKHRQANNIRASSKDVVAGVSLTSFRMLRQTGKVWDQLNTGDQIWLITANEWNYYSREVLQYQNLHFRLGKKLEYRHPSTLSTAQLTQFIESFYHDFKPRNLQSKYNTPIKLDLVSPKVTNNQEREDGLIDDTDERMYIFNKLSPEKQRKYNTGVSQEGTATKVYIENTVSPQSSPKDLKLKVHTFADNDIPPIVVSSPKKQQLVKTNSRRYLHKQSEEEDEVESSPRKALQMVQAVASPIFERVGANLLLKSPTAKQHVSRKSSNSSNSRKLNENTNSGVKYYFEYRQMKAAAVSRSPKTSPKVVKKTRRELLHTERFEVPLTEYQQRSQKSIESSPESIGAVVSVPEIEIDLFNATFSNTKSTPVREHIAIIADHQPIEVDEGVVSGNDALSVSSSGSTKRARRSRRRKKREAIARAALVAATAAATNNIESDKSNSVDPTNNNGTVSSNIGIQSNPQLEIKSESGLSEGGSAVTPIVEVDLSALTPTASNCDVTQPIVVSVDFSQLSSEHNSSSTEKAQSADGELDSVEYSQNIIRDETTGNLAQSTESAPEEFSIFEMVSLLNEVKTLKSLLSGALKGGDSNSLQQILSVPAGADALSVLSESNYKTAGDDHIASESTLLSNVDNKYINHPSSTTDEAYVASQSVFNVDDDICRTMSASYDTASTIESEGDHENVASHHLQVSQLHRVDTIVIPDNYTIGQVEHDVTVTAAAAEETVVKDVSTTNKPLYKDGILSLAVHEIMTSSAQQSGQDVKRRVNYDTQEFIIDYSKYDISPDDGQDEFYQDFGETLPPSDDSAPILTAVDDEDDDDDAAALEACRYQLCLTNLIPTKRPFYALDAHLTAAHLSLMMTPEESDAFYAEREGDISRMSRPVSSCSAPCTTDTASEVINESVLVQAAQDELTTMTNSFGIVDTTPPPRPPPPPPRLTSEAAHTTSLSKESTSIRVAEENKAKQRMFDLSDSSSDEEDKGFSTSQSIAKGSNTAGRQVSPVRQIQQLKQNRTHLRDVDVDEDRLSDPEEDNLQLSSPIQQASSSETAQWVSFSTESKVPTLPRIITPSKAKRNIPLVTHVPHVGTTEENEAGVDDSIDQLVLSDREDEEAVISSNDDSNLTKSTEIFITPQTINLGQQSSEVSTVQSTVTGDDDDSNGEEDIDAQSELDESIAVESDHDDNVDGDVEIEVIPSSKQYSSPLKVHTVRSGFDSDDDDSTSKNDNNEIGFMSDEDSVLMADDDLILDDIGVDDLQFLHSEGNVEAETGESNVNVDRNDTNTAEYEQLDADDESVYTEVNGSFELPPTAHLHTDDKSEVENHHDDDSNALVDESVDSEEFVQMSALYKQIEQDFRDSRDHNAIAEQNINVNDDEEQKARTLMFLEQFDLELSQRMEREELEEQERLYPDDFEEVEEETGINDLYDTEESDYDESESVVENTNINNNIGVTNATECTEDLFADLEISTVLNDYHRSLLQERSDTHLLDEGDSNVYQFEGEEEEVVNEVNEELNVEVHEEVVEDKEKVEKVEALRKKVICDILEELADKDVLLNLFTFQQQHVGDFAFGSVSTPPASSVNEITSQISSASLSPTTPATMTAKEKIDAIVERFTLDSMNLHRAYSHSASLLNLEEKFITKDSQHHRHHHRDGSGSVHDVVDDADNVDEDGSKAEESDDDENEDSQQGELIEVVSSDDEIFGVAVAITSENAADNVSPTVIQQEIAHSESFYSECRDEVHSLPHFVHEHVALHRSPDSCSTISELAADELCHSEDDRRFEDYSAHGTPVFDVSTDLSKDAIVNDAPRIEDITTIATNIIDCNIESEVHHDTQPESDCLKLPVVDDSYATEIAPLDQEELVVQDDESEKDIVVVEDISVTPNLTESLAVTEELTKELNQSVELDVNLVSNETDKDSALESVSVPVEVISTENDLLMSTVTPVECESQALDAPPSLVLDEISPVAQHSVLSLHDSFLQAQLDRQAKELEETLREKKALEARLEETRYLLQMFAGLSTSGVSPVRNPIDINGNVSAITMKNVDLIKNTAVLDELESTVQNVTVESILSPDEMSVRSNQSSRAGRRVMDSHREGGKFTNMYKEFKEGKQRAIAAESGSEYESGRDSSKQVLSPRTASFVNTANHYGNVSGDDSTNSARQRKLPYSSYVIKKDRKLNKDLKAKVLSNVNNRDLPPPPPPLSSQQEDASSILTANDRSAYDRAAVHRQQRRKSTSDIISRNSSSTLISTPLVKLQLPDLDECDSHGETEKNLLPLTKESLETTQQDIPQLQSPDSGLADHFSIGTLSPKTSRPTSLSRSFILNELSAVKNAFLPPTKTVEALQTELPSSSPGTFQKGLEVQTSPVALSRKGSFQRSSGGTKEDVLSSDEDGAVNVALKSPRNNPLMNTLSQWTSKPAKFMRKLSKLKFKTPNLTLPENEVTESKTPEPVAEILQEATLSSDVQYQETDNEQEGESRVRLDSIETHHSIPRLMTAEQWQALHMQSMSSHSPNLTVISVPTKHSLSSPSAHRDDDQESVLSVGSFASITSKDNNNIRMVNRKAHFPNQPRETPSMHALRQAGESKYPEIRVEGDTGADSSLPKQRTASVDSCTDELNRLSSFCENLRSDSDSGTEGKPASLTLASVEEVPDEEDSLSVTSSTADDQQQRQNVFLASNNSYAMDSPLIVSKRRPLATSSLLQKSHQIHNMHKPSHEDVLGADDAVVSAVNSEKKVIHITEQLYEPRKLSPYQPTLHEPEHLDDDDAVSLVSSHGVNSSLSNSFIREGGEGEENNAGVENNVGNVLPEAVESPHSLNEIENVSRASTASQSQSNNNAGNVYDKEHIRARHRDMHITTANDSFYSVVGPYVETPPRHTPVERVLAPLVPYKSMFRDENTRNDPLHEVFQYFKPFLVTEKYLSSGLHVSKSLHTYQNMYHNVTERELFLYVIFQLFGTVDGVLVRNIKMTQVSRCLKDASLATILASQLDIMVHKITSNSSNNSSNNSSPMAIRGMSQSGSTLALLKNTTRPSQVVVSKTGTVTKIATKPVDHNSGHSTFQTYFELMFSVAQHIASTASGKGKSTPSTSRTTPKAASTPVERDLANEHMLALEAKFRTWLLKSNLNNYAMLLADSQISQSGILNKSCYKKYSFGPVLSSSDSTDNSVVMSPHNMTTPTAKLIHSPEYQHSASHRRMIHTSSSHDNHHNEILIDDVELTRLVWERNSEQIRQIYTFYASCSETRRVGHGPNKLLASIENCKEMLTDFQVIPGIVNAQDFIRIFRSCKLWEWHETDKLLWYEGQLQHSEGSGRILHRGQSSASFVVGGQLPHSPSRGHFDTNPISPLSADDSPQAGRGPGGPSGVGAHVHIAEDPYDFKATVGNLSLSICGFMELLTRIACNQNKLGSRPHESLENLMHLMDASNGKAKLIGTSRKSVAVRHFIYAGNTGGASVATGGISNISHMNVYK